MDNIVPIRDRLFKVKQDLRKMGREVNALAKLRAANSKKVNLSDKRMKKLQKTINNLQEQVKRLRISHKNNSVAITRLNSTDKESDSSRATPAQQVEIKIDSLEHALAKSTREMGKALKDMRDSGIKAQETRISSLEEQMNTILKDFKGAHAQRTQEM